MKQTVNERVKVLRKALGMSQNDFANDADLSVALVSKMETGTEKVTETTIDKLNRTFKVPKEWLLHGKGELIFEMPVAVKSGQNPYQDVLYKELKEQINFLKETIRLMAGGRSNFLRALNNPGLNKKRSLRAAA